MKNKLTDLNNHLFAQLERLSDESLNGEAMESEIARTVSIVSIADTIISNADLQLKAAKLVAEHGVSVSRNLPLISDEPVYVKPKLIKAAGTE